MTDIKTIHGDCIEEMKKLDAGSIDFICVDPPYGTTKCRWDSVIPFDPMWEQVWRVLKPTGIAVFTATQPFTTALIYSQFESYNAYKYDWIWEKERGTGFQISNYQPMRIHEYCHVFYREAGTYNKQLIKGDPYTHRGKNVNPEYTGGGNMERSKVEYDGMRNPTTIIRFPRDILGSGGGLHPTQKPVLLMRYLIKTHSNAGDTVLDFTAGSGTTGVACVATGRHFIGIEKDPAIYKIMCDRLATPIAVELDL